MKWISVPVDGEGQDTLPRHTCATAEEAALYYARHVGAERAAAEAAEARVAMQQPLTADEARAAAAAEGLELMPSSKSKTGFKGVSLHGNVYQAQLMEKGKKRYLGTPVQRRKRRRCTTRGTLGRSERRRRQRRRGATGLSRSRRTRPGRRRRPKDSS